MASMFVILTLLYPFLTTQLLLLFLTQSPLNPAVLVHINYGLYPSLFMRYNQNQFSSSENDVFKRPIITLVLEALQVESINEESSKHNSRLILSTKASY